MTTWTELGATKWKNLISKKYSEISTSQWGEYVGQAITSWMEEDATQWKDLSYRLWSYLTPHKWDSIPQNM